MDFYVSQRVVMTDVGIRNLAVRRPRPVGTVTRVNRFGVDAGYPTVRIDGYQGRRGSKYSPRFWKELGYLPPPKLEK